MGVAVAMICRTFVKAFATLGLATQLWAWPEANVYASTRPVLSISDAASADEASELVEALRQAPGCMKASVFAASDGRFAIFQTWMSESVLKHFWTSGTKPSPAYTRLEV